MEGLSERFWVAETVLKTVCLHRRVGSNPTPSANSMTRVDEILKGE